LPKIYANQASKDTILEVGKLMLSSAITAPKAGGIGAIDGCIIYGEEELLTLAQKMEELSTEQSGWKFFKDDARAVLEADAVVLLGPRGFQEPVGGDCGLCGYTCDEFWKETGKVKNTLYAGPYCGTRIFDLGFAIGSACKVASTFNVDNMPMFSVGTAATRLRLLPQGGLIIGIPISITEKSPFHDRVPMSTKELLLHTARTFPMFRTQYG